ncbi:unnamed protein product [Nippostrongylus brasiliensis]|uniref:PITH domain-containing protein n=1 Tax=Nippostrongylus brasiliensis TaxID=27835 RepID=A0A0N4YWU2_NIPBR|nr:unnamed protein product [Nippostrongylus brasiliensis]
MRNTKLLRMKNHQEQQGAPDLQPHDPDNEMEAVIHVVPAFDDDPLGPMVPEALAGLSQIRTTKSNFKLFTAPTPDNTTLRVRYAGIT